MFPITELAADIAAILSAATGETWIVDSSVDDDWRAFIESGEKQLFISNTWGGKGRIYISGQFPTNSHRGYHEKPICITVSDSTTRTRIAAAIERRLLPVYEPELAKVLESIRAQEDYNRSKLVTYMTAVRILGAKPPQYESEEHSAYFGHDLATVKTLSPTKVELKNFQVTPEELRKLVNAVPELFTREEES
jgi:hypothetical protein